MLTYALSYAPTPKPVDGLQRALRDRIHDDVCVRGYDSERGTFTQFYGSQVLDAALLLIPRVGFLPWHDERVVGTVEAIQRELCEDGFVLRYRPDSDGGGNTALHLSPSFPLEPSCAR